MDCTVTYMYCRLILKRNSKANCKTMLDNQKIRSARKVSSEDKVNHSSICFYSNMCDIHVPYLLDLMLP